MMMRRMWRWWTAVFLGAVMFLPACSRKETEVHPTLYIAAAADLKFAMDDMIEQFEEQHPGRNVEVTYGSSGNFYAQLMNQAPFDIYFSADLMYPKQLIEAGVAEADTLFHYAVGRIVIWTPRDSPIDVRENGISSLFHPSVAKIAIANPRHAPYGVAAEAALRAYGVYHPIQAKLVLGENIAQAAQFIESGAAQIGVIALPLAIAPALMEKGVYWEIPLDRYPRMDQGGVILPWARDPEFTRAFRDFVLGEHGRAVLKRYGFFMPEDKL